MANYKDKLKDPRWQKKRLEIFKKYEELIMSIEQINTFDIINLTFLLQNCENPNEMFRKLSNALNSGWMDSILNTISDKEELERLRIELFIINEKLEQIMPDLS